MTKDKINPPHYKNKSIETIEAIKSQMTEAEFIGYLKGNIMKYVSRMGIKVPSLEGARTDVAKAHWYIEYLLRFLTDLIKKHNKDPNRDLTDQELEELLNPGKVVKFKGKEKKDDSKDPK
jgi:hypothetical protein